MFVLAEASNASTVFGATTAAAAAKRPTSLKLYIAILVQRLIAKDLKDILIVQKSVDVAGVKDWTETNVSQKENR